MRLRRMGHRRRKRIEAADSAQQESERHARMAQEGKRKDRERQVQEAQEERIRQRKEESASKRLMVMIT